MRQFMKVSVPTSEYAEVKQVGNRYLVRLEPVAAEDGMTGCYECMSETEPDTAAITAELQAWKQYLAEVELRIAKQEKLRQIDEYDRSPAVNSFAILSGGMKIADYWLDRDLRSSLEGDVLAASAVGSTYKFDIREKGVSLTLDCNKFLEALGRLRRYAYGAYNRTSEHIAAVNALATVAEVEAYDFTTGYPERLSFDVSDMQ